MGEPTYARAAAQLQPLLYARGARGTRLTASGVYYLPFGRPAGPRGTSDVMLHVGDGSELIARRAGGRSVLVRAGGERFGACLARLATPRLADGWLPILQTRYGRYRQESFAARAGGGLASYVDVEGPRVSVGAVAASGVLYARWDGRRVTRIDAADYDAARVGVVAYWQNRLAEGAQVEVPDPHVQDALRALLVQELTQTWRYSVGNPYEEFSFPEGVDVAQVLDEWGFADVAASILRASLTRPPNPYPNWKRGEKLLALGAARAPLGRRGRAARGDAGAARLRRGARSGSSSRAGCSGGSVIRRTSRTRSTACTRTRSCGRGCASSQRRGTRPAAPPTRAERGCSRRGSSAGCGAPSPPRSAASPTARSSCRSRLLDREPPYSSVTQERAGSYWNLVAPYALASGLFAPQSPQARGALAYMRRHGSRLLGLVRAGAYALYGRDVRFPVSGTDQVYGINSSRFLADMGEADELVLSLYGQLGAGMTRGTFVAGEGATVAPLGGERYRSMYLPRTAPRTRRSSRRCGCCSCTRRAAGLEGSRRRRRARGCGRGSGSSSAACRRATGRSRSR